MAAIFYLRNGADVECVGAVKDLKKRLDKEAYDLLILDTRMPEPLSVAFVEKLLTMIGGARLFLLFDEPREEFQKEALAAGVSGAAPKTMALDRFLAAVDLVISGQKFAPAQTCVDCTTDLEVDMNVSKQEQIVLQLAARGYSDKEIAADTNYKIARVKYLFMSARAKLCARDRTQAVMKARGHGII